MYLDFDFTYEITSVDVEKNNMHIKFSSPGKTDLLVGATLPLEGDDLTEHVTRYLPISMWIPDTRKFYIPDVGTTGKYNSAEFQRKFQEQIDKDSDEMIKRIAQVVNFVLEEKGIIQST